jgi:putative heme-binding domain-containing protein
MLTRRVVRYQICVCWRGIGLLVAVWCLLGASAKAQDTPVAKRPPWTTSRVQGSPEPPAPYKIVPAFPQLKFELPTSLEVIPGTNRLLITERAGRILSFANATDVAQADLVADLRDLLPSNLVGQNISLFDGELHPKFADNRYLFVTYVHPEGGGQTRVSRLTLTRDESPRLVPGSEQVFITWPSGGHNAGCLEFGADGYLYIATGDGSGPNPPDARNSGQDVSDLFGSILRIDVDHADGERAYSVPRDNPFVGMSNARPEIWAYGLRNPWKFGIDPQTNDIFASDNGWESWEMVHRIVRGGNCGWPVMEGRVALRSDIAPGPTPIIPPVKDHPHTEANSVIGGPVYRGSKLSDLNGSFVYGDYITGTIWAIRPDKAGAYSHRTLVDTDQRIVAFREGPNGELFVLDYDLTGQIYELLPSDRPDTSASFPRRLSETGLFASLAKMEPAVGVVPYSVLVEPWMDGADAQRWVAIPGSAEIELAASPIETSSFPEGTVLVKHLTLPQSGGAAIRLETQLLHYEGGVWSPYSYLWDDSKQDAFLVDAIGANRPLQLADAKSPNGVRERTWHVNATNECKLCHNAGPKFVLGFVANQLDGAKGQLQSCGASQLSLLAAQGVIRREPKVDDATWRLVDPHDTQQSLDDRARSYLHANCAMCHHPGGNAIVSFFLRRDLPFDKLNTNKGSGIGTFGIRDAKIIAQGDSYRSLLLYRMSKLGYARMPYIGSQVVDSAGVALVAEWIRSLPSEPAAPVSSPLASNSSERAALEQVAAKSAARDERDSAIRTLLTSTESALALAGKLHQQSVSQETFDTVASLGSAVVTSDVRGLFETFIPESKRRPTLGPNIDPQIILGRQGDRQRGKLIFFSDGARCRACHEIDDPAQSVGPTLQEINKKYARATELLQHVLQPSLKIDESFAAYAVLTNDGRAINGLLAEQNEKEIVIKTADKKLARIPRDSISEMQKSAVSLMPDRILSDLTAQEAADLFEYIRSLGVSK